MFGIFVGVFSILSLWRICLLGLFFAECPLNYFQEAAHRTASHSRGFFLRNSDFLAT